MREAVQDVQAAGKGDFGRVMKAVMPKAGGRADGATVKRLVEEELS